MLIIPHKSQLSESGTSENKLEQLISLRKKINQLEQLINEIMPSAIDEAINILSDKSSINGKNLVYAQKDLGKITVTFRKQYPSPKDNVTLQRLNEDITAEQKSLAIKHKSQLSELENQLNELEEQMTKKELIREKLMTNKRLINLKLRFGTERENGMELIPSLSVYLDK